MSGHSKWNNIKQTKGKMDALRGKLSQNMAKSYQLPSNLVEGTQTAIQNLETQFQRQKQTICQTTTSLVA